MLGLRRVRPQAARSDFRSAGAQRGWQPTLSPRQPLIRLLFLVACLLGRGASFQQFFSNVHARRLESRNADLLMATLSGGWIFDRGVGWLLDSQGLRFILRIPSEVGIVSSATATLDHSLNHLERWLLVGGGCWYKDGRVATVACKSCLKLSDLQVFSLYDVCLFRNLRSNLDQFGLYAGITLVYTYRASS